MTAERLRQAAARLREVAANETELNATWGPTRTASGRVVYETSQWFAIWTPPVALALADWLVMEADAVAERAELIVSEALDVADAILGDES